MAEQDMRPVPIKTVAVPTPRSPRTPTRKTEETRAPETTDIEGAVKKFLEVTRFAIATDNPESPDTACITNDDGTRTYGTPIDLLRRTSEEIPFDLDSARGTEFVLRLGQFIGQQQIED